MKNNKEIKNIIYNNKNIVYDKFDISNIIFDPIYCKVLN